MKRILFIAIIALASLNCFAQNGSFTATFTPANGGKPIAVHFTFPLFKYTNPHGYWFTNPHNGSRHLNIQPDAGYGNVDAGFITFSNAENDFEFYDKGSGDSNQVSLRTGDYFIEPPDYNIRSTNNKPLHIHYNTFTASEVSFTLSGTARYGTQKGNGEWLGLGTIEATGHFYREPQYIKSDVLPGCDCDPTIYGYVYDKESYIRSASGCENALANKVFDAVQKALSPLYTNVNYTGPRPNPAGSINVTTLAGHANIEGPAKTRPYCSDNYSHNWTVPFDFEKKIFTNDDSYGLRFIKIPSNEELEPGGPAALKRQSLMVDSVMKLYIAKKMSEADFEKFSKSLADNPGMDFKKAEIDHNLYLTVLINPNNREAMLLKMADKANTLIQHNIKGSAFSIYSPAIKESDGDWITNKMYIYLGQFSNPADGKSAGGYDAKIVNAVYPVTGNKLTIYNIIIKLEGGEGLIDKAVANIDFSALLQLINRQ